MYDLRPTDVYALDSVFDDPDSMTRLGRILGAGSDITTLEPEPSL